MSYSFDRTWHFPESRQELWDAISRTDDYPVWWTFISDFSSDGLVEGTTTVATIRAPLGYTLRLRFELARVAPGHLVEVDVRGDLTGHGRLEVEDGKIRLIWDVQVATPFLRMLDRTARPVLRWSHDLLVAQGMRRFRRLALNR